MTGTQHSAHQSFGYLLRLALPLLACFVFGCDLFQDHMEESDIPGEYSLRKTGNMDILRLMADHRFEQIHMTATGDTVLGNGTWKFIDEEHRSYRLDLNGLMIFDPGFRKGSQAIDWNVPVYKYGDRVKIDVISDLNLYYFKQGKK